MDGRAHNVSAVLRLLLGFVVLSTVAGLLMAGLAIPAVGATGQAAKGGVDFFNDLPERVHGLAARAAVADPRRRRQAHRQPVRREPHHRAAEEDLARTCRTRRSRSRTARFYEHGGLDVRGFSRALRLQPPGRRRPGRLDADPAVRQDHPPGERPAAGRQGGRAAAAVDKTYSRKLQELKYALNVEENFTKDQILEGYLNLVYYGDQAYGVEAAALNYFGVSAAKLNRRPGRAARRHRAAADRLQPGASTPRRPRSGATSCSTACCALGHGLGQGRHRGQEGRRQEDDQEASRPRASATARPQPYFCAYVMEYLQKSPQMAVLGKTPAERLKTINQGGLTIRTTLKPAFQKTAQKELTKAVTIGNKQNLGGAVIIVEPGTGKILAMAQATDFAEVPDQPQRRPEVRRRPHGYQIGSTAKMFALVDGARARHAARVDDHDPVDEPRASRRSSSAKRDDRQVRHRRAVEGPQRRSPICGGPMSPARGRHASRSTRSSPPSTSSSAPARCATPWLKMGLHRADGRPSPTRSRGIALGAGESTPLSVATAYATLAADGKYCEPYPVTSITTPDKKAVKIPARSASRSSPRTSPPGSTTSSRASSRTAPVSPLWDSNARPAAGKTGTTEKHNQIWFSGYTPQLATVVWIGNLKPASKSGKLYTLAGKCFGEYGCVRRVYGWTVAAPIWSKIMRNVTEGMPVKQFRRAVRRDPQGRLQERCRTSSAAASASAKERLEEAGFSGLRRRCRCHSGLPAGHGGLHRPGGSAPPRLDDRPLRSSDGPGALPAASPRRPRSSRPPQPSTGQPGPRTRRARRLTRATARHRSARWRAGTRPSARPTSTCLDDGGHPAAVGASGHLALGGLHDLTHLRHAGRAGRRHRPLDDAPGARRRRAGREGSPRARRARPPRSRRSSGRPASR